MNSPDEIRNKYIKNDEYAHDVGTSTSMYST